MLFLLDTVLLVCVVVEGRGSFTLSVPRRKWTFQFSLHFPHPPWMIFSLVASMRLLLIAVQSPSWIFRQSPAEIWIYTSNLWGAHVNTPADAKPQRSSLPQGSSYSSPPFCLMALDSDAQVRNLKVTPVLLLLNPARKLVPKPASSTS